MENGTGYRRDNMTGFIKSQKGQAIVESHDRLYGQDTQRKDVCK